MAAKNRCVICEEPLAADQTTCGECIDRELNLQNQPVVAVSRKFMGISGALRKSRERLEPLSGMPQVKETIEDLEFAEIQLRAAWSIINLRL